ncbi:hypothetical protein M3Y95_00844800 [Aphelenchoides besseyi]|nr:hypothetical protein M3Y95_00844800 [Aphelenchoides besseyi]
MGCFQIDVNGSEIVEFQDAVVDDPTNVLFFHQVYTTLVSITAIFMNAIVGWIVWHSRNDVCKMRPVLLIHCVIDFIWQIMNLILHRFLIAGYGRSLYFFNNGLHQPLTLSYFMVARLLSTFTLISQDFVPVQFLYRYYLVRFGDRPRGWKLVGFVLGCSGIIFVHYYYAIHIYPMTIQMNSKFLNDSMVILDHYGYHLQPSEVYGGVTSSNVLTWRIYASIFSYLLIIACAVSVRRRLRVKMFSSITRRLNAQLDKMLATLAVIPIFANIWPVFLNAWIGTMCAVPKYLNLSIVMILVFAPLAYPLLSLWFIKPYRMGFVRIIRCSSRTSQNNGGSKNVSQNLWVSSVALRTTRVS